MTPIIKREAWARRFVAKTILPTRPATGVVIHHAVSALEGSEIDTDNDGLPDSFETLLRQIEDFHLDERGWRGGIAYSILVGHRYGRKAEGRGWGLQSGATGDPDDRNTVSVCAVGNYDGVHDATDGLVRNVAEVIAEGITLGHLVPLDRLRIYSHHEKPFATACCGRNLIARLPEVRPMVAAILADPDAGDDDMLTVDLIRTGHTAKGADEFAREALADLGFRPGAQGLQMEQAVIRAKRQWFPSGSDFDGVIRGPFWRRMIAELSGACPEAVIAQLPPADCSQLETELAKARGELASALTKIRAAKDALV